MNKKVKSYYINKMIIILLLLHWIFYWIQTFQFRAIWPSIRVISVTSKLRYYN